jgi:WhiB family transcriptional regulator, redox-sensing transcriptional regulator
VTAAEWSLGAAGPLLLREEREAGDWRDRARCLGADPGLFFPPDEREADSVRLKRERAARYVCNHCPVRLACGQDALEREGSQGIDWRAGIFGGMTERQRYAIARGTLRALPAPARRPAVRPVPALRLTAAEAMAFRALLEPGCCGTAWAGPVQPGGLGLFEVRRDGRPRHLRAHRVAYQLLTGRDPGTDESWQKCGQPLCCTPACLAPATSAADVPASETRRGAEQRNAA